MANESVVRDLFSFPAWRGDRSVHSTIMCNIEHITKTGSHGCYAGESRVLRKHSSVIGV